MRLFGARTTEPTGKNRSFTSWRRFRSVRFSVLVFCLVLPSLANLGLWVGQAGAAPVQWSVTPSPSQASGDNDLNAVSCATESNCVAVGSYINGAGVSQTLVESWNGGTWSIIPSPNATGNNDLEGLSCISSTYCVAVGNYNNNGSGTVPTLIESWNGTTWTIIPSPSETDYSNLNGVSCLTPTDCVAVGNSSGQTLVESWSGSSWTIIPSPNQGSLENALSAVSCMNSGDCVAVGEYYVGETSQTLVESWNGSTWSIVSSPSPGKGPDSLNSVSCVSSAICTAVGVSAPENHPVSHKTLVESWNGSAWSTVASPDPGSSNVLSGVSCKNSTDCVAAGNYYDKDESFQTLVESWNGKAWLVTTSPNASKRGDSLSAVSCTGSVSCVAVGNKYPSNKKMPQRTLVETGSRRSSGPNRHSLH